MRRTCGIAFVIFYQTDMPICFGGDNAKSPLESPPVWVCTVGGQCQDPAESPPCTNLQLQDLSIRWSTEKDLLFCFPVMARSNLPLPHQCSSTGLRRKRFVENSGSSLFHQSNSADFRICQPTVGSFLLLLATNSSGQPTCFLKCD